jgi:hypothetical protein
MTIRAALCWGLLLLVPLAVYAPTVFHEYGLRDDYSLLRESHEAPRDLLRFTSSYGRPVFGALLVGSLRAIDSVIGLQWLRLISVLLLAVVALTLARTLRRAGWPWIDAVAVGLAIALLPSAQIVAGWAIAWPIAFSLLCAIAGFAAVDRALAPGARRRAVLWSIGLAAYVVAALTYQAGVMFAIVPLAAAALLRDGDDARKHVGWLAAHLATSCAGVAAGLAAMKAAFGLGLVPASAAIAFETDPAGKLLWFVEQPLANALALFALRDRFDTPPVFWLAPAATATLLAAGLLGGPRPTRGVDKAAWLICLLVLPFVAHAVSLAAAVRTAGYRTLFPLAGLVVVLAVYALRRLQAAGWIGTRTHATAIVLGATAAAALAGYRSYALIAEPQGREWAIVRDGVRDLALGGSPSIFVVRPRIEERSTRRIFADEFGSLSSNSDWATEAMFKAALDVRFPNGLPTGTTYELAFGLDGPGPGPYDAVIDMRRLAEYRGDRLEAD